MQKNYPYIVVDNEAGMEHISRGILQKIDTLILVSGCSRRGVQATGRIAQLASEQNLNPGLMDLIINRAPEGKLNEGTSAEIEKQGLNLLGIVPQNKTVYQYDCNGTPKVNLPEGSPVREAVEQIAEKMNL